MSGSNSKRTMAHPNLGRAIVFYISSFMGCWNGLKDDLQPKLNQAWVIGSSAVNRIGNRRSIRPSIHVRAVDYLVVSLVKVRKQEVRSIQDVEELCPELNVEGFRNLMDGEVLEQGKV